MRRQMQRPWRLRTFRSLELLAMGVHSPEDARLDLVADEPSSISRDGVPRSTTKYSLDWILFRVRRSFLSRSPTSARNGAVYWVVVVRRASTVVGMPQGVGSTVRRRVGTCVGRMGPIEFRWRVAVVLARRRAEPPQCGGGADRRSRQPQRYRRRALFASIYDSEASLQRDLELFAVEQHHVASTHRWRRRRRRLYLWRMAAADGGHSRTYSLALPRFVCGDEVARNRS